jgi:hypothetical protein
MRRTSRAQRIAAVVGEMRVRLPCEGPTTRRRWRAVAFCAALLSAIGGCVSQPQVGLAIGAVNRAFKVDYEAILAAKGTRVFAVPQAQAFEAMRLALRQLGMRSEVEDPLLGYLAVVAPAPLPLDKAQWDQASNAD